MLAFLYFAFKDTDVAELWKILSEANYWWVLAMFPFLMLSHMFRAWRWEYFLQPIKQNLKYRNLFASMVVGYMMNNLLPARMGELVRPYAVGKLENIPRSAAFGTVLMERIVDILSFMFVIALIPLVYSGPLTQAFPWLEETGIWITSVTLFFFALCGFLMVRRDIVEKILNYIRQHTSLRTAKLIDHMTHSFLDGFLFLKEPKNYFAIILLSVLVWGLYIVMMYVPFYAFGLPDRYPQIDFSAAMVVQAISSIGIVIPTPGATGPYHYFTIQTLTKLYSVDDEVARSYAAVTHAVGFIGVTLVGMYFFIKDNLKMADVMKKESAKIKLDDNNVTAAGAITQEEK